MQISRHDKHEEERFLKLITLQKINFCKFYIISWVNLNFTVIFDKKKGIKSQWLLKTSLFNMRDFAIKVALPINVITYQ